jgi:hypothetical protein
VLSGLVVGVFGLDLLLVLLRLDRLSRSRRRLIEPGRRPERCFPSKTREKAMAGGTKPRIGTRRAERFKDGLKKAGGLTTQHHAGPTRASKTRSTGIKGSQLQKRAQP